MFLRARKHEKIKILNSITSTDGWDESAGIYGNISSEILECM